MPVLALVLVLVPVLAPVLVLVPYLVLLSLLGNLANLSITLSMTFLTWDIAIVKSPMSYFSTKKSLYEFQLPCRIQVPHIQSFSCGSSKDCSVCLTVRPPVRPSVCLSICHTFLPYGPIIETSWNLHQTSYDMLVRWTISAEKVKCQAHRGCFKSLSYSLWLRGDLIYICRKYNPWRDNESSSISRSIGEKSRSHGSFEIKVTSVIQIFFVSAQWLCGSVPI